MHGGLPFIPWIGIPFVSCCVRVDTMMAHRFPNEIVMQDHASSHTWTQKPPTKTRSYGFWGFQQHSPISCGVFLTDRWKVWRSIEKKCVAKSLHVPKHVHYNDAQLLTKKGHLSGSEIESWNSHGFLLTAGNLLANEWLDPTTWSIELIANMTCQNYLYSLGSLTVSYFWGLSL